MNISIALLCEAEKMISAQEPFWAYTLVAVCGKWAFQTQVMEAAK